MLAALLPLVWPVPDSAPFLGRFLLICLIHAESGSCLLETRGERDHGGGAGPGWPCAHPLLSASAKLFPRQDGGAGGPPGAPQPQNQLRQAPVRPGGGYRQALPQVPQNGGPLKPAVQSRPPPPPPLGSDRKVTRRQHVTLCVEPCPEVTVWQAGMYPSPRTGQKPADSARRASPQTPRKRPSPPLTSSALFIDGQYVQMQTSAKGRGKKVSVSNSKPRRFMSTQGRWLQGRYKSISGDGELQRDPNSGATSRNSKFFKSTNAVLAPSSGKGAQNPVASKRPSGNPSVQYASTQVFEIPEYLGGFAIRRLKKPGKRKPQQAMHLQEGLSPRMHQGARPGSSLTK